MARTPEQPHHADTVHAPVLLQEVIAALDVSSAKVVVDGTLGGAGHAKALALLMQKDATFIGIDRDKDALERARHALESVAPRVVLKEGNFSTIKQVLAEENIGCADALVLDLGFSSDQLERSGRGFSFVRDEPLLMTLCASPSDEQVTAEDAVNGWSEESLADVLYGFGGERYARRIARAIVLARSLAPIATSGQLAAVIESVVPKRGKLHPATRTFQALRIAVNDELGSLETLLNAIPDFLALGGRVAIISFHSLEDRLVKHAFRSLAQRGYGDAVKKPILPSDKEIIQNPRARSARLRIFHRNYEANTPKT